MLFRSKIKNPQMRTQLALAVRMVSQFSHGLSREGGWWNDPHTGEPLERNKGEMLCLIHSEVSEAMEGARKNCDDDHLPHRKMEEVELADALIRICDYAEGHGLDIANAVVEKLLYNTERLDHTPAARAAEGGKAF